MTLRVICGLCLFAVLLVPRVDTFGFETDQYDLPPKALADIGDEVTQHVEEKIRSVIDKVNAEISAQQQCLAAGSQALNENGCDPRGEILAKLSYLRSGDAIIHAVYKTLGAGTPPFTSMGTWMDRHHFHRQPARYRTSYWKSIFIIFPHICFTISPTVNFYGSEFGTDKIAHFFQQGYSYYKIYRSELSQGATLDEAERAAVRWGQMTERTYFGTLVAGVYSNADLEANYVGFKFYQRLTREIKIGATARPPLLVLNDGYWTFNPRVNVRESLIRPFISDHLNEALNPSIFTEFLGLRAWVRHTVRRRSCRRWLARYPGLSQSELSEKSLALRRWFGNDYGFTDSEHFITIANTCFEDEGVAENRDR